MPIGILDGVAVNVDPLAGSVETGAKVMVNGDVVFNVVGGPIAIQELISVCQTANGATASTLQYRSDPTGATATTFSGASASLANAAAVTTVRLHPTALSTAPAVVAGSAGGVALGLNVSNKVIVHPGTISLVIGVGSTTGTWKHYIRYTPMTPNAAVSANQ